MEPLGEGGGKTPEEPPHLRYRGIEALVNVPIVLKLEQRMFLEDRAHLGSPLLALLEVVAATRRRKWERGYLEWRATHTHGKFFGPHRDLVRDHACEQVLAPQVDDVN